MTDVTTDLASEDVVVAAQFRGPPNSGNGGYVCGLMAARLSSPRVTGVLRAPIPIDTALRLVGNARGVRLTGLAGDLIADARAEEAADLPAPPAPPSLAVAERAGATFIGLTRALHPICFTCAPGLDEGFGLRVFVGQLASEAPGVLAGVWTPHVNFSGADGLVSHEALWAALDCPGSFSWLERGGSGGLLGTMTCEVLRRPAVGEPCIVLAWPIEASGRKSFAGTALYSADGELMARSRQIWIGRPPALLE